MTEHLKVDQFEEGDGLEVHIGPFDLVATFSEAILYILPLATFVVAQPADQIVQRLFEPGCVSRY